MAWKRRRQEKAANTEKERQVVEKNVLVTVQVLASLIGRSRQNIQPLQLLVGKFIDGLPNSNEVKHVLNQAGFSVSAATVSRSRKVDGLRVQEVKANNGGNFVPSSLKSAKDGGSTLVIFNDNIDTKEHHFYGQAVIQLPPTTSSSTLCLLDDDAQEIAPSSFVRRDLTEDLKRPVEELFKSDAISILPAAPQAPAQPGQQSRIIPNLSCGLVAAQFLPRTPAMQNAIDEEGGYVVGRYWHTLFPEAIAELVGEPQPGDDRHHQKMLLNWQSTMALEDAESSKDKKTCAFAPLQSIYNKATDPNTVYTGLKQGLALATAVSDPEG